MIRNTCRALKSFSVCRTEQNGELVNTRLKRSNGCEKSENQWSNPWRLSGSGSSLWWWEGFVGRILFKCCADNKVAIIFCVNVNSRCLPATLCTLARCRGCRIGFFRIHFAMRVVLQCLSDSPSGYRSLCCFLDPEGGSEKAILVVLLVVISYPRAQKSLKAFLIRRGAQWNFAYTFVLTLPADLPSQIVHLFSN